MLVLLVCVFFGQEKTLPKLLMIQSTQLYKLGPGGLMSNGETVHPAVNVQVGCPHLYLCGMTQPPVSY